MLNILKGGQNTKHNYKENNIYNCERPGLAIKWLFSYSFPFLFFSYYTSVWVYEK